MNTLRSVVVVLALLAAPLAAAQNLWPNWESPHVHPLELTPDGTKLLAVNTADQRLEVFTVAASDGALTRVASISVGIEPTSVRARSNGEAWVVNHLSDSVSIIDLTTLAVARTITVGDEPRDLIFAGTPRRAYVSMGAANQVRVFDPANPTAAPAVIALQGEEPRALAASPDGNTVYVGFFESGNLTAAVRQQDVSNAAGPYGGQNPPPNSGATFDPPMAAGLAVAPAVAQIVRRDAAGAWRDDNGRDWSAFVGWNLLDHDVAAIDTATQAVSYADHLMTTVMALAVRPDGRVAAVGTEARNEIRFEPKVQSIFATVKIASFAANGLTAPSLADLNPQLDYSVRSVPQSVRNQALGDPRGILWQPGQNRAFVTGMGSNNVIVTDASGARLGRIDVGQGPTGLALSNDGARLYVLNKFDASISRIDTTLLAESARTSFFDPTPAAVKAGRPLLYDTHATSGLGQVSCATCHIDGRSDFLAWDLGNPAGAMKAVDQPCRLGQTCRDWHPMKGPMVTQVLQGIVGNGAMHWRGDRENIAAFAPAFTGLQGADSEPGAIDLTSLETFVASLRYPPNPNRNLDGSLPTSLAVTGGTGDPNSGQTLYQTLPVLAGGATCVTCHALPTGTTGQIDDPMLALAPQSTKIAQLRGLWKKTGWQRASAVNTRGFGFNSDSEFDTLQSLLLAGFNFGAAAQAPQRRRDVEAFLLALDSETPAAVGQQVTFDGSNGAGDIARLSTLIALADAGTIGLVAKSSFGGREHGYVYVTGNLFVADEEHQSLTADALRATATAARTVTYTAVPAGAQFRMGVDRDGDGYFDGDEGVGGSDPAASASVPLAFCRPDVDGNGVLDSADVSTFNSRFTAGSPLANYDHSLGTNGLPTVNAADLSAFNADVAAGCGGFVFADGFE